MARSKYINTFDTTAEYNNYIESALPEFPNVGYDKEAGKVNIRRQSPNDYQIWGTTPATSNFNIKLNNTNVEVTVDPLLGEFYLTGWTGILTSLQNCFYDSRQNITSIKKFALDTSNVTLTIGMFQGCSSLTSLDLSNFNTSNVTNMNAMFADCSSLTSLDLSNFNTSNVTNMSNLFISCSSLTSLDLSNWDASKVTTKPNTFYYCNSLTDVYITVESTLMKLTNNLSSQGGDYIPSNNGNCTIHYNDVDYKWQNNAWTPQS